MENEQKNIPTDYKKGFTAKKSLGQNFLHAPHVVGKMIHEVGVEKTSIVLEVGPGKGVLTRGLLDTGARVIAVEKDDRAIEFLSEKFAPEIAANQLLVIHQDVLEFDPSVVGLKCGEYLLAANIPYYITGEFLRKFLETNCAPEKMILMLQKEVAKRIVGENSGVNGGGTAKNPKIPKESILSISVKAYGTPKYIITVPARFFRPVPNVDSALLLIENISKDFFNKNGSIELSEDKFFSIVKAGFAHKRKVLIKNLEAVLPREKLTQKWQEIGLSPTVRAENLTLDQWRMLAGILT